MGIQHTGFGNFASASARDRATDVERSVEIFVCPRFSELEVASITNTLSVANDILDHEAFSWRFVSDTPGFVSGAAGMMVRAEPAIQDHGFSDVMIVVGGGSLSKAQWLRRARTMQRKALPVVLLSDAATAYIKRAKRPAGHVTTHWRDLVMLAETGFHPNLTARFSENSDGIITGAGAGATAELIIGLIAPLLDSVQVAELGNRLLLHTIRKNSAEQPQNIADNAGLFEAKVNDAIRRMEGAIADPIPMTELAAQLGLSTRHLERLFRQTFDQTPAKFYKRLRTRRARVMIEETVLPLVDVAVATGFGSCDTLARAVKEEFGQSPSKMRTRKKIALLSYTQV